MIDEVLDSPLSKFIPYAANDYGYNGTAHKLIVDWVHPFFLKAKAEASKEDNQNWWQAMSCLFANEYWKATGKIIDTLEGMLLGKLLTNLKFQKVII